jgi:hypothetical protein
MTWHVNNIGENNPAFKGDNAGYFAIHAWVRRRKPKPLLCEKCLITPPRDLANKSGKYLRDASDWEYLCRFCHMEGDGRNEKLRQAGKSRKLGPQLCWQCNKEFHRDKIGKFCPRTCYLESRKGKVQ